MAWLAIRLEAAADVADALGEALLDAGAQSVSCDDAEAGTNSETPQYGEPGLDPPQTWRRTTLTALASIDDDPERLLAEAARACAIAVPPHSVVAVADEDWVRLTQRQFEPINVTGALWIVPSWCPPPLPDALNICIDPGLAFGTGSHATTRLVLRWLAATLHGGETVLDYGCGSGILAIAAARLGAGTVLGVDIDPQAVAAAKDNAGKNGVNVAFCLPDAVPPLTADIVVANILANPLIVLAPLISARCGARLALSGILESQADEVAEAYRADFVLEVTGREDGWILMTGARR
jgi:ribosomal protein L11 methyltransferase